MPYGDMPYGDIDFKAYLTYLKVDKKNYFMPLM